MVWLCTMFTVRQWNILHSVKCFQVESLLVWKKLNRKIQWQQGKWTSFSIDDLVVRILSQFITINHSNATYSLSIMFGITLNETCILNTAEQVRDSSSQRINNRLPMCYTSPLGKSKNLKCHHKIEHLHVLTTTVAFAFNNYSSCECQGIFNKHK